MTTARLQAPILGALAAMLVPLGLAAAGEPSPVRDAIVEAFAEAYPDAADRLEVRLLRLTDRAEALSPEAAVRLRRSLPPAPPTGRTALSLERRAPDGTWQSLGNVMVYVAHYDSVVVATESLRAGEKAAPEALALRWTETTDMNGTPLTARTLRQLRADGAVYARRHLRADRVLREGDLRTDYAAETGAAVTMHYRRGAVELVLSGTARQSGFVGDEIRVYVTETSTTYRARLTAPGTAVWIETL